MKRNPFFIKYKQELYTILKRKGFEFDEQKNQHTKDFKHKSGEKLYFIVAETELYNQKTKKDEAHFVFIREYINFEKNDHGEYKKVIVNENKSIPMTHSFYAKKNLLSMMLTKMESHLLVDEGKIKKISRQSEKIAQVITVILMVIFMIWIYSKCN